MISDKNNNKINKEFTSFEKDLKKRIQNAIIVKGPITKNIKPDIKNSYNDEKGQSYKNKNINNNISMVNNIIISCLTYISILLNTLDSLPWLLFSLR